MGFSFITTFPDACNVKLLCYSCGCQNFPALNDWLCEGVCCCLFNSFGLKELFETQICCLGPCSSPTFVTNFGIPSSPTLLMTILSKKAAYAFIMNAERRICFRNAKFFALNTRVNRFHDLIVTVIHLASIFYLIMYRIFMGLSTILQPVLFVYIPNETDVTFQFSKFFNSDMIQ
eukprot:gene4186-5957_t